mmetsp:Transcript_46180/g.121704  ORF Transcript_46180/g.121704 Transcript_46180/m.121704 type:complete len:257 (-) Transcript_46180:92-862(-)
MQPSFLLRACERRAPQSDRGAGCARRSRSPRDRRRRRAVCAQLLEARCTGERRKAEPRPRCRAVEAAPRCRWQARVSARGAAANRRQAARSRLRHRRRRGFGHHYHLPLMAAIGPRRRVPHDGGARCQSVQPRLGSSPPPGGAVASPLLHARRQRKAWRAMPPDDPRGRSPAPPSTDRGSACASPRTCRASCHQAGWRRRRRATERRPARAAARGTLVAHPSRDRRQDAAAHQTEAQAHCLIAHAVQQRARPPHRQ